MLGFKVNAVISGPKGGLETLVEFWQGKPKFRRLSPETQKGYLFKLMSFISLEANEVFACLLSDNHPLIVHELPSADAQRRLETVISAEGLAAYFQRMAINDDDTPASVYIRNLLSSGQVIRISNRHQPV
jgi:hypothetical protein